MRLKNYITASFILHLMIANVFVLHYLSVNILGQMMRGAYPEVLVYNVEIVTEQKPPDVRVRPSRKVPKKSSFEIPPKTMFGDGPVPTGPSETATDDLHAGTLPDKPAGTDQEPLTGIKTPGSFLFDRETIEKYASRRSTGGKELTFNAPDFHHRGYMRRLKDKIENIWKYPSYAAKRGVSGDLYIRFVIKRDGTLDEIELIRTSGYKDLDYAAMKALKDAEPYWPLPDDWENEELPITGHFVYLLRGFYIR